MNEEQQPDPKISLVEVILIGLIFALFDAIEIVIVFLALDDFWIIDITASIIFFYLLIKGVPPIRQLVCWILELIPYVGALPLLTIGWGLTVWADHHPSGALAKTGAIAGTAQGKKALAKGGAKTKGAGTRSFERMGRAEGKAAEWKTSMDKKLSPKSSAEGNTQPLPAGEQTTTGARPSTQPSGRRNIDGVVGGNGEQTATPDSTQEGERQSAPAGISRKALGEKPTPFEELEELTKEPLQQPTEEEDEEQSFSA
ncbi:MAG: hypothetical protein AAB602_00965 [Patescibacteria group bacterium]